MSPGRQQPVASRGPSTTGTPRVEGTELRDAVATAHPCSFTFFFGKFTAQ